MFHFLKINHMKRDYFAFNYGNSKIRLFKKYLISSLLMLSISWTYSQNTLTVQTVSSLNPWNITVANPGGPLTWNATGAVVQTQLGDNVDFDFSSNVGNGTITVSTTGTPAQFSGINILIANSLEEITAGVFEGQKIFSIDLSDLANLEILNLDNNTLISIDLSNNPILKDLDLSNNGSLTALDVSSNPLLRNLNMENTSLTSLQIDDILNELDLNGQVNGNLNFAGISTGTITANGIQSYVNLVGKGWNIVPPQGFDRGDAPDSYLTSLGNNGPLHFFDLLNDRLRIGLFKDNDLNRPFGASADAVVDDYDDPTGGGNDEDGVDITQFDNFFDNKTVFSLDVTITNILGADS